MYKRRKARKDLEDAMASIGMVIEGLTFTEGLCVQ